MALADILARILEEAGEQAREIRARGEEEGRRVLAEAESEADALRKELILEDEQSSRGHIVP